MISGATGFCYVALLGSICPMKFTGSVASNFDPLNPFPVLIFLLSIKGSVCRAQCMFQWLGSLFHISACVVCPMITLPLGAPVSHRDPVSAVVCNLGCFGVLLSIYCYFLAHERHPSS